VHAENLVHGLTPQPKLPRATERGLGFADVVQAAVHLHNVQQDCAALDEV
jgi:hypothetical protein